MNPFLETLQLKHLPLISRLLSLMISASAKSVFDIQGEVGDSTQRRDDRGAGQVLRESHGAVQAPRGHAGEANQR